MCLDNRGQEPVNDRTRLYGQLHKMLKDFANIKAKSESKLIKRIIERFKNGNIQDKQLAGKIQGILDDFTRMETQKEFTYTCDCQGRIKEISKKKKIDDNIIEVITLTCDERIQVDLYTKLNDGNMVDERTLYSASGGIYTVDYINGSDPTKKTYSKNDKLVLKSEKINNKYYGEFDYGTWQTTIYKDDGSVIEKAHNDLEHLHSAKCTKDGKILWEENVERKDKISTLTIYNDNDSQIVLVRDALDWILNAKQVTKEGKVLWTMEGLDNKINESRFSGDMCKLTIFNENGSIKNEDIFTIGEYKLRFLRLTHFSLGGNDYLKPDRF